MVDGIRVLIVDDSAFARMTIARELKSAGEIEVVDFARNGIEALEKIKQLKPDVVTLDVEMPQMDGLETLKRIMTECPTPTVMLSSLTGNGTDATLKALELGAVDFFLKNTLANPLGSEGAVDNLKNKLLTASRVKTPQHITPAAPAVKSEKPSKKKYSGKPAENIVLIGSSTGGPKALYQIVPGLPEDIPAAVLIVQHMPPGFTNSLAVRLDQLSNIFVKEAEQGELIYEGTAYVAKGGYHMVVAEGGILALTQTAPVCGVRPSVNVTMESVVEYFGGSVLGVVLTGMGIDGTVGAQLIKQAGGRVLVQDEASCVVYGMPKSVVQAGYSDGIIPLTGISMAIMDNLQTHIKGAERERSRVHFTKK
ncbi:MAG TPA: chemotaxis response regulator protein-glutamate methylesterase [Dehalococcoidales bacterium]|nr:chemotaxis response regulator protein-glutamate methylesterase [Dehalococcoidales bacterium]